MRSVERLLAGTVLIASMLSCSKSNSTGVTGTGFIWVATQGNQEVDAFHIDLSNGSISAIGTNQPTGAQPSAMAITPDGKALFIANTSDNTISSYTVNSDGTLKAAQGTTPTLAQGPSGCTTNCMSLGLSPIGLAVDPTGAFLFVVDEGQPNNAATPGGISVFKISGTSLSPIGPACPANFSLATCPLTLADTVTGFSVGPLAAVAAPVGNFLYVAETFSNQVQSFSYDGSGNLQAIQAFPTGNNPSALAFSRCAGVNKATTNCAAADANTLFVANAGSNTLSTFAACIQVSVSCSAPTGNLVEISSAVAAGTAPVAIAVDPAANLVYAINTNSNTVSQYKYSPATGALSPMAPASLSTGASPFGVAVTSDGTYVIVSNNNGTSMSAYSISSTTGQLSLAPTPSVTLAGQPSAILIR